MSILALAILPVVLLAIGVPVFLVLIAIAICGVMIAGSPLHAVHTAMFGSLDTFPLLAVPLFIYAGDIMARGGIARRLIELILSFAGRIRGSLGLATIGSCVTFGVMSGSSVACVAAIGKLTIPALRKNEYGERFSVSLVTASGVIDVIIPPSIPMIIYGIAAQQSIAQLFLAGFVPGLLVALVLGLYVYVYARVKRIPVQRSEGAGVSWKLLAESIWALLAPVVVLGGIYGGVFTPTEAAGVACVYAIFVSVVVYRELSLAELWEITVESAALIGQILIIVSAAGAFAWLITTTGLPASFVALVDSLQLEPWILLLVINVVLLLVGSVLEPPAAILILTPLLTPIVLKSGIDPLHFGIVVTVNLAIGMFMPPFGLNLFASHALFRTPLPVLYRGVLPFLVLYLLVLMLLTYVPAITLAPMHYLR